MRGSSSPSRPAPQYWSSAASASSSDGRARPSPDYSLQLRPITPPTARGRGILVAHRASCRGSSGKLHAPTEVLRMRVIEREVVARHAPARTPICGFVTYVSDREPVLIRRMGWEVADDVHDEFVDLISRDNGRTWGEPRTSLRNVPLPGGGYTTFTENAALYVPERDVLLTFTYQKQHASLAAHDGGRSSGKVHITTTHSPAAPGAFEQSRVTVSDFGFRQGLLVSFPTPIIDSRGRVVVPVCNQLVVTDAAFLRSRKIPTREDMPDVPLEAFEDRLLIGEFDGDGEINWHVSGAVPFDLDRTLYLCEGTVAELTSGRFVKVLRGTNRDWPERPGYKWASYSDNAGETWTP